MLLEETHSTANIVGALLEAFPKILGQFKGEQKRIGRVTFPQFAREVFAPVYRKAAQSAA